MGLVLTHYTDGKTEGCVCVCERDREREKRSFREGRRNCERGRGKREAEEGRGNRVGRGRGERPPCGCSQTADQNPI